MAAAKHAAMRFQSRPQFGTRFSCVALHYIQQ